ncbi:hypothetical protein V1517DRAFT_328185 [Lipomyces orientalis]|uniref:Uncharacterized protein n=1 Tax=Lipomyces orientalis TaxID=1233043 RepID=A0ACC3TIY8_9ASCO
MGLISEKIRIRISVPWLGNIGLMSSPVASRSTHRRRRGGRDVRTSGKSGHSISRLCLWDRWVEWLLLLFTYTDHRRRWFCFVGCILWSFMADYPSNTRWLTPQEQLLAAQRLTYDGVGMAELLSWLRFGWSNPDLLTGAKDIALDISVFDAVDCGEHASLK